MTVKNKLSSAFVCIVKAFQHFNVLCHNNMCYVKATRKKLLSRGFGSFLMEYLMKKTHRADQKRTMFLSFKWKICLIKGLFWRANVGRSESPGTMATHFDGNHLITSRANFQFLSHKIICFYLGSKQTLLRAVYKGYCQSAHSCLGPVPHAS